MAKKHSATHIKWCSFHGLQMMVEAKPLEAAIEPGLTIELSTLLKPTHALNAIGFSKLIG